MSSRYEYIELACIKKAALPDICLSNNNNYKLRLFRILSGTINLRDTYTGKTYKLRRNYFTLPCYDHPTDKSLKAIKDLFEDEVTLNDLNRCFKNNHKNREFYKKLEGEISRCIISNNNGLYINAFLHLYRSLECVSYCFPLLYASKSKEYLKTYNILKKFMGTEKDPGELKFFRNFVEKIFKEEDFMSVTIDIDFDSIDVEREKSNIYSLLTDKKFPEAQEFSENEELKYSFIDYFDFLISLRNRYFHLLQGSWNENISSIDTEYPEFIFKLTVEKGINWISVVVFEILKFDLQR